MNADREKALEAGATMKTGGVNFQYVDTAKLERLGIGSYSTKKPKGENYIRIVAPSTKGTFALEIFKHSEIGSSKATYLCLQKMFGKSCPICEYQQELKKQGAPLVEIKALDTTHRFLLFVVDTTSRETEEEGPKWFDCPITIYKEVCVRSENRRTGQRIDPTDPENGRDVEFVRVDGKRTTYTGINLVEAKPIPKSWYEDLPSFEEIILMPDPDEMRAAVTSTQSSPSAEDDSRGRSRDESETTETRGESRRSDRGEPRDDSEAKDSVKSKLAEIKERKSQARE